MLEALNGLGPSAASPEETPRLPEPHFSEDVTRWRAKTGASEVAGVFLRILAEADDPSPETVALVAHVNDDVRLPDTPEGRWLGELAERLQGKSDGNP